MYTTPAAAPSAATAAGSPTPATAAAAAAIAAFDNDEDGTEMQGPHRKRGRDAFRIVDSDEDNTAGQPHSAGKMLAETVGDAWGR